MSLSHTPPSSWSAPTGLARARVYRLGRHRSPQTLVGASRKHPYRVRRSDFREGGRDVSRCIEPGNADYVATVHYLDIRHEQRIVFTEDVTHGNKRVSAALISVELTPKGKSTHLALTMQIASFDGAGHGAWLPVRLVRRTGQSRQGILTMTKRNITHSTFVIERDYRMRRQKCSPPSPIRRRKRNGSWAPRTGTNQTTSWISASAAKRV